MFNRWIFNRFCSRYKNYACHDISFFFKSLFFGTQKVTVLQIGANDGVMCDPLFPYVKKGHVKGVFLEPQKKVFQKLCENLAGVDDLHFVNAALHHDRGKGYIFKVSQQLVEKKPELSGVASFDKSHVLKEIKSCIKRLNIDHSPEAYLEQEQVEMVRYEDLFEEFNLLNRIDLLMIDAEGFDIQAVRLFPFGKIPRPGFIVCEYKHFSSSDKASLENFLAEQGYIPYFYKNDVVFVLNEK